MPFELSTERVGSGTSRFSLPNGGLLFRAEPLAVVDAVGQDKPQSDSQNDGAHAFDHEDPVVS